MKNKLQVCAAMALSVLAFGATSVQAGEITHSMGVTDVPDAPQRVIVLTNEGTEAALSVGVVPVGAANSWNGDPWYDHVSDVLKDTQAVGKESAVNLELVAALQPDLILGNKQRHEEIYEQLSAIAPTVLSERLRGDWQVNFKLYADALGKKEKGDEVLAAYQSRVTEISAKLGDALNEQVSVIRFLPSQTRIYQKDSFSGVLLDQLGFKRPAIQDVDEFAIMGVTKERIPDMDGDRIFYFTWETGNGEGLAAEKEWLEDPLWAELSAVKAGKVHSVSDTVWNTAGGVIAANLMLDDIEKWYGVK
jgi:iron complex transport system substrate-binding protein